MINSFFKNLFGLFLIASVLACSPKVTTNTAATKPAPVRTNEEKPAKRFTAANISLLIPFKLNQFNLQTVNKSQLEKADMAIDFYQGVMLGIDSAAAQGLNFNVSVFDTKDENSQLAALTRKEKIKNSDLIIGPVFPDGIKYFSDFAVSNNIPMVSPLAASRPAEFNNPKLISIVNNIDQHGQRIADYIAEHYHDKSAIIVLINTRKTADEQFAAPIRSRFKTKYPSFIIQEFTSTYDFERRMIRNKKYAVVICSSDPSFVSVGIDKLYKLNNLKDNPYEISLFGHPNWIKQSYKIEQLQHLSAIISTSYKVDYKSEDVITFVKKYRAKYNFEPSEYSFKGFDIGYYFGKLLTRYGADYLRYLTKEKYDGLHNHFNFEYDQQTGYFNKSLILVQYSGLALNVVD